MTKGKTKEPEAEESTIEANAGAREESRAAELDNMRLIYEGVEIDLSAAVQGVRDATLEVFKHRRDPWHKLSEREQKDVATAIEYGAKVSVRKVAEAMAAKGRPHVRAMLKKYQDDGGKIAATLEINMADTNTVVQLHQASGKEVILITADADEFANGKPAQTQTDEPDLDFEAGSDEADEPAPPADDSDLAEPDRKRIELSVIQADAYRDAVANDAQHAKDEVESSEEDDWFRITAEALGLDPDSMTVPDEIPAEGVFTVEGEPIAS